MKKIRKRERGAGRKKGDKRGETRRRKGEKPEGEREALDTSKTRVAQPSINSTCRGLFVKAELSRARLSLKGMKLSSSPPYPVRYEHIHLKLSNTQTGISLYFSLSLFPSPLHSSPSHLATFAGESNQPPVTFYAFSVPFLSLSFLLLSHANSLPSPFLSSLFFRSGENLD